MLEISNLTKIYKSKKSEDVIALDNVSLKFPETGMVFLLGKSGSGKSTLLNVTGGLDSPTSGEIIIKGKSSKNFTQADFDSYRNTYVGFIFQDYNILEEFSVYDNIALAIELQNKKVDHDVILNILKDVDLEGYEKRKPNTLSGGQKQRIAIARALVKHPEIIMADEPTGALDSTTGKQVFDTLKKLSKDKLVIVVSHDREFAETYADRIIELKDGKVISDNSKVFKKSNELSENINVIGETLVIENGNELNENEFSKIKDFLKDGKNIILSKDSKNVSKFKKIAKINDNNEQEMYEETNNENIILKEYDQNKNIFIKSKLPLKHAIKIGLSGLKTKSFRLLITIILCSTSFLLFGLLSTLTFYNSQNVFKDTLKNYEYDYIRLGKEYKAKVTEYYDEFSYEDEYFYGTSFYEEDYNNLVKKYGNEVFYGVNLESYISIQKTNSKYYTDFFTYFSYIDENNSLRKKIHGSYPVNDDEILLSSFIVDSMIYYNAYDYNNVAINIKNREDIIGKEFAFVGKKYKVVGYFDSGEIPSKYDELKTSKKESILDSTYHNYLKDSLHLNVFVSKSEINNLSHNSFISNFNSIFVVENTSILDYSTVVVKGKDTLNFAEYSNASFDSSKKVNKDLLYGREFNDDSVYVSPLLFAEIVVNEYGDILNANPDNEKIYLKAVNIMQGGENKEEGFIKYSVDEIIEYSKELFDEINDKLVIDVKLFSNEDNISYGDIYNYNIDGVYFGELSRNVIVLSDKSFNTLWDIHKKKIRYYTLTETKYVVQTTPYQYVYVPAQKNDEFINDLWNIYDGKSFIDDASKYSMTSTFTHNLYFLNEYIDILSSVFLYGGIFLCIFALLLLSNFISLSISNKTKEIGILRAVGARSIDVFKIFFSESFTIMVICLVLSIVMTNLAADSLNKSLAGELGVSVFVFGFVSLAIMIAVAFVATVVATFLPVRKAAKKKPVETIRSL